MEKNGRSRPQLVPDTFLSAENCVATGRKPPVSLSNATGPATTVASWYDYQFPPLPESNASPAPAFCDMHIASRTVTNVFTVHSDERNVDRHDRACRVIIHSTNAQTIEIWSTIKALTFLVTGKPHEVIEARHKILLRFQTKLISIPREYHRWIVGKKGARLQEVQRITATKINVPTIGTKKNIVCISGTLEGIQKAETELRRRLDKIPISIERVIIPKIFHPFIVGPHSENVYKMMEETGAKINIPPPSVQKDEIIITGEKEGVLQAKARIEAISKDMEKKCTSVGVEVPRAQHKYIVGPKGSTIQEILSMTGVSVEMPSSESQNDTITLRGPKDKLGNALSVVYQKAKSVRTTTLECPQWIHKYIIGRKGGNIKKFTAQYPNVHVKFNEIEIEGLPEQVDASAEALEKMVEELTKRLTFAEMMVDSIYYRHIIGKNGAKINRMTEEYEVIIKIDPKKKKPIHVEEPIDGVKGAKQEILDMIANIKKIRDS